MKRRQFLQLFGAATLSLALPKLPTSTVDYVCSLDADDMIPEPAITTTSLADYCTKLQCEVLVMNGLGEWYVSRNLWSDDITWEQIT